MADGGVRLLAEHLASVKLAHEEEVYRLKKEAKGLRTELDDTRHQLNLASEAVKARDFEIARLKEEATRHFRVQERSDWHKLVQTLQAERTKLLQRNAELEFQAQQLGASDAPAARDGTPPQAEGVSTPAPSPRPAGAAPSPQPATPKFDANAALVLSLRERLEVAERALEAERRQFARELTLRDQELERVRAALVAAEERSHQIRTAATALTGRRWLTAVISTLTGFAWLPAALRGGGGSGSGGAGSGGGGAAGAARAADAEV